MPAQMRGASSRQALDILQKVVWNERTQIERKNRLFVSMPDGISTAIRRRRTVVRRFFSALEPSFCTPAVRRIFSEAGILRGLPCSTIPHGVISILSCKALSLPPLIPYPSSFSAALSLGLGGTVKRANICKISFLLTEYGCACVLPYTCTRL